MLNFDNQHSILAAAYTLLDAIQRFKKHLYTYF